MRTIAIVALAAALTAGCGKRKTEAGTREAAPASAAIDAAAVTVDAAVSVDAAVAAAMPVECEAPLRALAGLIGRMHNAMEPQAPRTKAIAAWQAIEPPCRRGAWYLAAAQLERWREEPLVAGGVTIAGAGEALVAGLAAGDDRGVLVLTAYVAGLGGKPTLPRDACARATAIAASGAEAADQLAYVCGHAAFAAGDLETAAAQLAAIATPARYPDVALRLAQVEAARGNAARAKELAAQAAKLDEVAARGFGVTDGELTKLRAAAKTIK